MPPEMENWYHSVEVAEEEIQNNVRDIPCLVTLILVKAMVHQKIFKNPFRIRRQARGSMGDVPPPSATNGTNGELNRSPEVDTPGIQMSGLQLRADGEQPRAAIARE